MNLEQQSAADWGVLLIAEPTMKVKDGGIFDLLVLYDQDGYLLPHPLVFRGVLVRKRGELMIATDASSEEVTVSLVTRSIECVPRGGSRIMGVRARGNNADTFASQSWVLFPARLRKPRRGIEISEPMTQF